MKITRGYETFSAESIAEIHFVLEVSFLILRKQEAEMKEWYQISAEDMPSPYSLFDRVLLLNSYTKYDYMDLQDRAMRDPKVFLDNEYLNKENNYLKEKYSFSDSLRIFSWEF